MSCCILCNGKGRTCDFCGFDLPEEYVQEGDNDYCNNDVPEGQKNCWQSVQFVQAAAKEMK